MNFEQAFFDELEKIAEAGDYLPGGKASQFLARARAAAEGHRQSLDVPMPMSGQLQNPAHLRRQEASHLAGAKLRWAYERGNIPAPSEATGGRRLTGLHHLRLPGSPVRGQFFDPKQMQSQSQPQLGQQQKRPLPQLSFRKQPPPPPSLGARVTGGIGRAAGGVRSFMRGLVR